MNVWDADYVPRLASLAQAPAKMILMGEHGVVHGCTATVATLGLYCDVRVETTRHGIIDLHLPDIGVYRRYSRREVLIYALNARLAWQRYRQMPTPELFDRMRGLDDDHLVKCAVGESLAKLSHGNTPGLKILVSSQIPRNSGLGSSAAIALAIPAAIGQHLGDWAHGSWIKPLARTIEQRQHGQPSGVDHQAIFSGKFIRYDTISGPYSLDHADEHLRGLQVFNTGPALNSTGEVVNAVRKRLHKTPWVLWDMYEVCEAFVRLMGKTTPEPTRMMALVHEYEELLERLGVVPEPVRRRIRQIERAGGAAKISGAGALQGDGAGLLQVYGVDRYLPALGGLAPLHAPLGVDGLRIGNA